MCVCQANQSREEWPSSVAFSKHGINFHGIHANTHSHRAGSIIIISLAAYIGPIIIHSSNLFLFFLPAASSLPFSQKSHASFTITWLLTHFCFQLPHHTRFHPTSFTSHHSSHSFLLSISLSFSQHACSFLKLICCSFF